MRPFSYDGMLSMRGDFVLGLLFCLVAGPAPVGAEPAPWTWSGRLPKPPPPEFAGPYEGKLTIKRIPLAEISEHCRNAPRVLGCAYGDPNAFAWCNVYIPNDLPPKAEAAILTHELGHCHGWKHPIPKWLEEKTKPVEDRLFD
jgi:hypothetical protein